MITRNLRSRKLNSRNTKNSNLQTRWRGFEEGTDALRLGSDNDIPEKIWDKNMGQYNTQIKMAAADI